MFLTKQWFNIIEFKALQNSSVDFIKCNIVKYREVLLVSDMTSGPCWVIFVLPGSIASWGYQQTFMFHQNVPFFLFRARLEFLCWRWGTVIKDPSDVSVCVCVCVRSSLLEQKEDLRKRLSYTTHKLELLQSEFDSTRQYLETELRRAQEELDKFTDKLRRWAEWWKGCSGHMTDGLQTSMEGVVH